ncbi:MAG TPA: outer membrane beta-barrel protein, partial [Bacteroidia bacterium]|nr:outer membrane beta-barrel protein [Bacteroidia bacterium]
MRKIYKNLFVLFALCYLRCIPSIAQKDSAVSFKIGGYVDAYYAAYTDSVGSGKLQKFPAISPHSNSFGVNIAQATMRYNSYKLRSTVTLQAGDMPSAAWSPVYNFIQEANVGVKLCKTLWFDAGFFKTHIGTEALLPKDNIASSVSMITFFEPWWQAGGRLTYAPNEQLQIALYVVDGYNEFVAISRKKAIGLAVSYALGLKGSINYNNFISDNTPDNYPVSHTRFLNNLV